MSIILNGQIVRDKIKLRLTAKIRRLKNPPTLAIIQVGDSAESNVYIKHKLDFGRSIGVNIRRLKYPTNVTDYKLISQIKKLNEDQSVGGIIVQLPLPPKLDKRSIVETIDRGKDVDGLRLGSAFIPATARGVLALLKYYHQSLKSKHAVVVGRSALVGRPIAQALLAENATVTVCHSKTRNLARLTKQADILIVAAGRPKLIGKKHIRPGQTIVDVGINIVDRKLIGDVDFKNVAKIVRAISPVPGGVGPLTVASLFANLLTDKPNGFKNNL